MIYAILAWVAAVIVKVISIAGYFSIFILMTLESCFVPIPSEIIMPFSGYLVYAGKFSMWLVVAMGVFGNLAGSVGAYFIGFYGGRRLVEKYGKYVLISQHDLDLADSWFKKYGGISVLFSRMLPVVRTFFSLPAGTFKMPFWRFCLYTFLGSIPWTIFLAYVGFILGKNWSNIDVYFRRFDWVVVIGVVLLAGFWIYKKIKNKNN